MAYLSFKTLLSSLLFFQSLANSIKECGFSLILTIYADNDEGIDKTTLPFDFVADVDDFVNG